MKKRIEFKNGFGDSQIGLLQNTTPLDYLGNLVRFSFKYCRSSKGKCIKDLESGGLIKFYERMGKFEDLTYRDVTTMPREKGFSIEKKGDSNHKWLEQEFPNEGISTFLHFRITGTNNNIRVYGGLKNKLCYVLIIDPKGEKNH